MTCRAERGGGGGGCFGQSLEPDSSIVGFGKKGWCYDGRARRILNFDLLALFLFLRAVGV